MTNLRNWVAITATAAFVAIGHNVIAQQDDYDDLERDMNGDSLEELPDFDDGLGDTIGEDAPEADAEDVSSDGEEGIPDVDEEPAGVGETDDAIDGGEEDASGADEVPAADVSADPGISDSSADDDTDEIVADDGSDGVVADSGDAADAAEDEQADQEDGEPAASVEGKTEDEDAGIPDFGDSAKDEPAVDALNLIAELDSTSPEPEAGEDDAGNPDVGGPTRGESDDAPEADAGEDSEEDSETDDGVVSPDGAEPADASAADGVAGSPASAAKRTSPKLTSEEAALLDTIGATERIRIESLNDQAERERTEALRCLASEEYLESARHYALALKLLKAGPKTQALRTEFEHGIAVGLYQAAMQEYALGRRERALKLIQKAIEHRHPKARRQKATWEAEGDPDANKTGITEIRHVRNDPDYKSMRMKNNQHLKRAQQYFSQRQLDKADDECGLVLVTDPYNQEAIRLRRQIQRKRQTILQSEFDSTREGMIADVDRAWRPIYAINAREVEDVKNGGTRVDPVASTDPERAQEQSIIKRMKDMRLPAISFKPPATIIDAVEYFRSASKDFDSPELPFEQRGFNFVLKTPETLRAAARPADDEEGGFMEEAEEDAGGQDGVPVIPMITASDISFYEALKLVCESVDYKFKVQGQIVMVMHKNMSIDEMVTRSYPVLSSFMDRMTEASDTMKEMQSSGFGGARAAASSNDDGEESQEKDWKAFFELLGVKWPEGSSIMYIKTIGKLRVRNTYENLAELEQALTEMNADPKLIEIETRFVEVCQEDLNSLGFEWILNSDYSLNLGSHVSRALGLRNGVFDKSTGSSSSAAETGATSGSTTVGGVTATSASVAATTAAKTYASSQGASWVRGTGSHRNIGISAIGGQADMTTGQRYLSTLSNHISGEGYSTNDQFMRLNAFLGGADLSMILHMLSQRSDTDLLSAPKVLTKSGEEAVMKVVTEYIYPTDYDVQLQSSQSGGGNNSSSQSAILAVVEPQSFTMREVGVILDVTPTLTDDGNLIDLELNTQVVDEPTWKNYGMRIPFTGNSSLESFEGIGDILGGLAEVLNTLGTGLSDTVRAAFAETAVNAASDALSSLTQNSSENITYYDAPMEQPFFHVRSVNSKLSVYPGATIVMGGLITEQRKAMDDKVPFLGDLPFIGRLFRSHSEQTVKRNLLIFVTTRLVDTQGRELKSRDADVKEGEVKPAPDSES
ncbi:MAG: hypothetical protein K6F50_00410 [Kiritimatiellae bacterium]|nr:hypothetical protein [Kiritimatiellia bacterium]